MKQSKRPPRICPSEVSMAAWRSPVFPMEDVSLGGPQVVFSYSEVDDILLPEDYRPTKYDVINGRGKKSYNHIANRRFRQLTAMNLKRYQSSKCKVDKTMIVVGIVNAIRRSSPMGGFIKKDRDNGRWISMSDEGAREKVGHCLRDMNASQREEKKKAAKEAENDASQRGRKQRSYLDDLIAPAIPKTFAKHRAKHLSTREPVDLAPNNHHHIQMTSQPPQLPSSASQRSSFSMPSPPTAQREQVMVPHVSQQQQQQHQHQVPVYDYPVPVPSAAAVTAMMTPQNMNPYYMAAAAQQGYYPGARFPHPNNGMTAADVQQQQQHQQQISSTFNNFDYGTSSQRTGDQEMSEQQQHILCLLENGFRGSVEAVLEAAQPKGYYL